MTFTPSNEPISNSISPLEGISREDLAKYARDAYWYHSIQINDSIRTNGTYDIEPTLPKYGFPLSLKHKTVLDVGCADGFFAFEFEKRGAKEVCAIDSNSFDGNQAISPSHAKSEIYSEKYKKIFQQNNQFLPLAHKLGFNNVDHRLLLKKIKSSSVRFEEQSIYHLKNTNVKYDLVFCGALIEHLKNPIEAVEALKSVCKDTCIISLSNTMKIPFLFRFINLFPKLRNRLMTYHGDSGGTFFHFHPQTFKKVLLASGFSYVVLYSTFTLKNNKHKNKIPHVVYHCKV